MNENSTLYDTLDLKPDASQQEVREAYVRTKSAYNKDSLALYTLISSSEREDMLRQVEEAYEVLSNPEKRKEYDRCHGLMTSDADFFSQPRVPNKKIISIDRVPPMEPSPDGDRLLVAPATDFDRRSEERAPAASQSHSLPPGTSEAFTPGPIGGTNSAARVSNPTPQTAPQLAVTPVVATPNPPEVVSAPSTPPISGVEQEISVETDWKGPTLKRMRDVRRVSIEEMASITKISKTYINAIEEEDFKKLPAPVFVRGFLMQIARVLRLPAEQVATPYRARYNKSRGNG